MKQGVLHQKVKGFKLKDKDENTYTTAGQGMNNGLVNNATYIGNLKLTDDILFQGLNSDALTKAYEAAQKFTSNLNIINYLIKDGLEEMDQFQIEEQN